MQLLVSVMYRLCGMFNYDGIFKGICGIDNLLATLVQLVNISGEFATLLQLKYHFEVVPLVPLHTPLVPCRYPACSIGTLQVPYMFHWYLAGTVYVPLVP